MSGAASSDSALPARAWRTPAAWLVLLVVLSAGLLSDLWTKHHTFRTVGPVPVLIDRDQVLTDPRYDPTRGIAPLTLVPADLLDLHLVLNRGAVFGVGQDKRPFFIGFTLLALLAGVAVFGWWTTSRQHLAHGAFGLILAGGIGNLHDRWLYGAVRDFLHLFPRRDLPFGFSWWGGSTEIFPWVFNLADVYLLLGMGLLMLHIHCHDRRQAREAASAKTAAESTSSDHAHAEGS